MNIVRRLAKLGGIDLEKDIHVNDARFYRSVFLKGTLGLGESYMMGWFDELEGIDVMAYKAHKANPGENMYGWSIALRLLSLFRRVHALLFPQTRESKLVSLPHYDIGNELYRNMLGETMNYSCGVFSSAEDTLDRAQLTKMERIAAKLKLKNGLRVLDIGCGFGSLASHLSHKITG